MSSVNPKRVLIVDDNRDAADLLAILVRVAGHNTLISYDSLTGLDLARQARAHAEREARELPPVADEMGDGAGHDRGGV